VTARNMMIGAGSVAILTGFSSATRADSLDSRQYTADNAQAAISVCLAFYSNIEECAGRDAQSRNAAAFDELGRMSERASDEARLRPSDVKLRFDLNLFGQRTFMGDTCSGVSTLLSRYAIQCSDLLRGAHD
jgi:hypothetical protein